MKIRELHILYAGFYRAEKEWQYKNIISPFTRMYIFTGGEGVVYMNKKRYILREDELFIIPKFTSHTYECSDYTEHYYICFFDEVVGNQIFDGDRLNYHLKATDLDHLLMKRLVELNSYKALPTADPKKYDNRGANLPLNSIVIETPLAQQLESLGILQQLIARFLSDRVDEESRVQTNSKEKISLALNYIDCNLEGHLSVSMLAGMMCTSKDHFTKVFKKIMGITPSQYIQRARVNRAQTLLLTTRFSVQQIAEIVGIPNMSQFSTLFTKITGLSPRQYTKIDKSIQR